MSTRSERGRARSQRGGALLEFGVSALLLLMVILACFEFDRLMLTHTSIANAARAGARYAIVNGGTSSTPSGPMDHENVVNVVRRWAVLGMLNPARLDIEVNYSVLNPSLTVNSPGQRVTVTVSYPYDPWIPIPVRPTLRSTSAGVIMF